MNSPTNSPISLSTQRPYFLFFILGYWALLKGLSFIYPHPLTQDHLLLGSVMLALYYLPGILFKHSQRYLDFFHKLFLFILPAFLTGVVYDSQRYYSDAIRGTIHVKFPYWFDRTFFGIKTAQGILTPNEFWQLHTFPVLDFITGLFYLGFILFFILICAYFNFIYQDPNSTSHSNKVSEKISDKQSMASLLMWGFFWLNVIGYTTYYWFPAAPPWYVAMYGLGEPPRMDVVASAAGALRFDALLGTHFFTSMYGRSADVFGAIPSLHIAYPLLATLVAFQLKKLRFICLAFYLIMCFSAVYLNHHYVIDILWGSTYAILIWIACNYYVRHFKK
jgi:membrane-associated phospholipid phosphatase